MTNYLKDIDLVTASKAITILSLSAEKRLNESTDELSLVKEQIGVIAIMAREITENIENLVKQ